MKAPLVVAYGGGVNSTAMLVEFSRRGIRPDLILFADTGGERPETYQTVETVSRWVVERGMPEIETVRHSSRMHGDTSLEDECIRSRTLPSIAYGYKRCSQKWKVAPQEKFLNAWEPARSAWRSGGKVLKAIGYDAGESRRAKIAENDKEEFWYPLVEWSIHREDCIDLCLSAGLPIAKSACFFCPSSKRAEVLTLAKSHPELAARAVAMEENAELTSIAGLGRRWSWGALLNAERDQCRLFPDDQPEVPCGCYD